MKRGAILAILLSVPIALWGQRAELNGRKVVVAVYTETKITVDGKLDEPAWQTAQPATDFIQRVPAEGQPASEPTEVRILYDKEFLYIGAYCYDSRPDQLVVHDITRDAEPGQQDSFGVSLDTFHDRRNGYHISTSPHGGPRDTQFFNEGRVSNRDWNGVIYVETRVREDGWSVEFAIPFKTLRFSNDEVQVWGINFNRSIQHNNEITQWMPVPSHLAQYTRQVSYAGDLQGLEGVQPGRNLKVKPYVLSGFNRFPGRGKGTEGDFDGGVDVKYGLGSNLVLDLSLNTDFSQVEVDALQVNLTRFALFFPEKREFFLENSGLFRLGAGSGNDALLFHSRRIGLTRDGSPIPILAGARLTGRAGPYSLGFMNVQTRSQDSIPANNFTVGVVRRNILANSDVGAMFLNRQARLPNDYNRSIGADANFVLLRRQWTTNAVLAKTQTPGLHDQEWLTSIVTSWDDGFFRFSSWYLDVQENFNPEVGFVRRPNSRTFSNNTGLRFFQRSSSGLGSIIREISPHVFSDYILLPNGDPETKTLRPQLLISFQDGGTFRAEYMQNFERLRRPFAINRKATLPIGDYRFNDFFVSYSSPNSKSVAVNMQYRSGDFYSGTRRAWQLGGDLQPGFHFSTNLSYETNDVELPEGSFTTHLVNWKINYVFNARTYLNAFFQYNSDTNQLSSNIRFRFIHHPLSDFYVVYNDTWNRRQHLNDRELSLKYTHLLNF